MSAQLGQALCQRFAVALAGTCDQNRVTVKQSSKGHGGLNWRVQSTFAPLAFTTPS